MWFVKSQNQERAFYFTSMCTNITVGRKLDPEICNFQIPDDASISRKHATLFLQDGSLVLQDLESRYGTFINESIENKESVKPGDQIILRENDLIKFGKLNSLWNVNKLDVVTCTSTLKGENLQELRVTLTKIGGILKSDWDETCRFLTMPVITLTIKVVLALVHGSHVVTPEYWNKCLEAIHNQVYLPDPNDYVPQILESTLNKELVSFLPNKRRKTLFQDKTFVFFSKRQMEMYKSILLAGAASVSFFSETPMTKTELCQSNIIVIQYTFNGTSQESQVQQTKLNDLINHLKISGRRVIPDAEIGLAVLFCSLEKYCNPQFSFTSEVLEKSTVPVAIASRSDILAQETQDTTENTNIGTIEKRVIDESLFSSDTQEVLVEIKKPDTPCSKRKLSDENLQDSCNAPKKQAVESTKKNNVDEEDIFGFIQKDNTAPNSDGRNTEKKLDFLKPQKRKTDHEDVDEDLFKFLPEKRAMPANSLNATLKTKLNLMNNDDDHDDLLPQNKKIKLDAVKNDNLDISVLRGTKLHEMKFDTCGWKSCSDMIGVNDIKKEEINGDLEERMTNLDLGTTVVTLRNYKPVERNTSHTFGNQNVNQTINSKAQNFKKFKKVWPLITQVILIPESSVSSSTDRDHNKEIVNEKTIS